MVVWEGEAGKNEMIELKNFSFSLAAKKEPPCNMWGAARGKCYAQQFNVAPEHDRSKEVD